jgi:rhodanese-related sulfurtransferase
MNIAEKISINNLESHKNDFLIIDVRESDEITKGKIEHSMHIPLGLVIRKVKHGDFEDMKEKKFCTYCTNEHAHNETNEIPEIIPDIIPEEKKPLEPPSENYEDDSDDGD